MFVPRSVKSKPSTASSRRESLHSKPPPIFPPVASNSSKGNETHPNELPHSEKELKAERDLATLVELSVTNYAIWRTAEVRVLLESSEDGWIPLAALLESSPILADVTASETQIYRALRAHGAKKLEVQLSATNDSRAHFNVRRADWEAIPGLGLQNVPEEHWDACVIYVENIPPSCWKHPSDLVAALASLLSTSSQQMELQSIYFPPKFGSSMGDSKCRGFAFVVCGSKAAVQSSISQWSWDAIETRFHEYVQWSKKQTATADENLLLGLDMLAKKCGFRALALAEWTRLKEEYIRRQRSTLRMDSVPSRRRTNDAGPSSRVPTRDEEAKTMEVDPAESSTIVYSYTKRFRAEDEAIHAYPRQCLVFIRHVHPDTNKTTLKNLLGRAYGTETSGKELDYVDYTKGLDSCYVRLSNPRYSNRLLAYLRSNSLIQAGPLDDIGEGRSGEPLIGELIEGKREALYWNKVPEKIRRATLEKLGQEEDVGENEEAGESRPKQRRKR